MLWTVCQNCSGASTSTAVLHNVVSIVVSIKQELWPYIYWSLTASFVTGWTIWPLFSIESRVGSHIDPSLSYVILYRFWFWFRHNSLFITRVVQKVFCGSGSSVWCCWIVLNVLTDCDVICNLLLHQLVDVICSFILYQAVVPVYCSMLYFAL